MENSTTARPYHWDYEYYYDYLDTVIVDQGQLKYNKYSIVIIFWICLATFVGFLFLILTLMSCNVNFLRTRHNLNRRRRLSV